MIFLPGTITPSIWQYRARFHKDQMTLLDHHRVLWNSPKYLAWEREQKDAQQRFQQSI